MYPVCIVRHLTNNNYPRFRFHSDNHYEKNLILPILGYISANFIDLKLKWYNHIFLFIIRNIILSKQVKFLTSITEVSFLSSIFMIFSLPLQGPNSKVTYEILGTASAQTYFTINPQSGVISLAKSLYTTSDNSFVVSLSSNHCNIHLYIAM